MFDFLFKGSRSNTDDISFNRSENFEGPTLAAPRRGSASGDGRVGRARRQRGSVLRHKNPERGKTPFPRGDRRGGGGARGGDRDDAPIGDGMDSS